jgi:hypothetical protein
MTINTFVGSCAVGSIEQIGLHTGVEEVFATFCKTSLGAGNRYGAANAYAVLQCFYIFSAGPEVKSDEKGGSHHSKNHWPRYGTEFAQFLVDNNLGMVATLGQRENKRNHPGCTSQLWMWAPNQQACETWWNTYQKDRGNINVVPAAVKAF